MGKTLESHFSDWEAHVFGLGYGTGEEPILSALKRFMDAIGRDEKGLEHAYLYENLEQAVGKPTAWLLITILIKADIIEYGTSPRCGWLTQEGVALRTFVQSKTVDELVDATDRCDGSYFCTPEFCNCGEEGYTETKQCHNPFWINKRQN